MEELEEIIVRRKWGWIVASLALAVLLLVGGCGQHQDMVGPVLKRAKTTWYLYQGKGKSDVLSFQFNKADVVVKAVDAVGETAGENKLDSSFANPKYTGDISKNTVQVKASPAINLTFVGPYTGAGNGYAVTGYTVTYQGKTYRFVRLKNADQRKKEKSSTAASSSQDGGTSASGDDSSLANRLMSALVDVNTGAQPVADKAYVGTFSYRMFIGKNVAAGEITVNANGTYQNAWTELNTTKPADANKAAVISYSISTGQLQAAYGKEYLAPKNLLTVNYTVHGQNAARRLPQRVTLWTNGRSGDNINLARARIENTDAQLIFYSKDITPWPKEGLGPVQTGVAMTKASGAVPRIPDVYNNTRNAYRAILKAPVQSNADFMQLVGAITDANDSSIGNVAVDFTDMYGAGVKTTDYQGINKDGTKQAQMQYVFVVSPAKVVEGATYIINTQSGALLVFGLLDGKLYLLHQPDPDSSTVTWMLMNADLTVPPLQIRLNPGI